MQYAHRRSPGVVDLALGIATAVDATYRMRRTLHVLSSGDAPRSAPVVAGMLARSAAPRTSTARRHRRRATAHAARAVLRTRRIGLVRASHDRRVRRQLMRAGRQMRASFSRPPDHTRRNRLIAAASVAGVTGGLAYKLSQTRGEPAGGPAE